MPGPPIIPPGFDVAAVAFGVNRTHAPPGPPDGPPGLVNIITAHLWPIIYDDATPPDELPGRIAAEVTPLLEAYFGPGGPGHPDTPGGPP